MGSEAAAAVGSSARKSSEHAEYASGILLLVAGTVAFSSAGLFVRLIGKDAATILFWRGIFTGLTVLAFVIWRERWGTWAAFRTIGWPGLAIGLFGAMSMGCFITSVQYTTIANNSIIFGTAPFLTAGLAWLLIRERPSVPTLLFSGLAMLGAVLVVGSSLRLSGPALIGDVLAVLMTVTFALKTVLVRKHRTIPMVPSACVGAVMACIGAAPFVKEWQMSAHDVLLFAMFGFMQQGLGLILTTIGIARVSAAHSSLLMALDLPMSPMWVWTVFGERPADLALLGGIVVLTAIVGHIFIEGRRRRAA